MKPSPLHDRVADALIKDFEASSAYWQTTNPEFVGPSRQFGEMIADLVLGVIAEATPEHIVEEGTYLLGSSHLWADTQGTPATEHMVRRITGADQVVRGRMEQELVDLQDHLNAAMKVLRHLEWRGGEDGDVCPVCFGENLAQGIANQTRLLDMLTWSRHQTALEDDRAHGILRDESVRHLNILNRLQESAKEGRGHHAKCELAQALR